jgi:hypothetical protein
MHVIVNFIGIIVLTCMGSNTDPCTGPFPLHIRAYLPNAMSNPVLCSQALPVHTGFIRIKTKPQTESWTGAINCAPSTANKPCKLYPLSSGAITITDVTGSSGGISAPWTVPVILRWQTYEPQLKITPAVAEAASDGYLDIAAGVITGNYVKNGMFVSTLSVAAGSGAITVQQGGNSLVLDDKSTLDIVNLPTTVASDYPVETVSGHVHTDNPSHFYVHYLIADPPPAVSCCGPLDDFNCPPKTAFADSDHPLTATELRTLFAAKQKSAIAFAAQLAEVANAETSPPRKAGGHPKKSSKVTGAVSISCSNSTYP